MTREHEADEPWTMEHGAEDGTDAGASSSKEASKRTSSCLSPDNRGFFKKMTVDGKQIANAAYEGLYKTPGVKRIVGKLEIAYDRFWINRHEEKAVQLKNRMDGFDLQISALDESKREIESAAANLEQQNIPGSESLQLKLKDLEQRKDYILTKKDKIQSKFEARENKVKLHTNERDRVADKLISGYNEKLQPIEQELERLQTCKDKVDLLVAVTNARHHEQMEKLDDIKQRKERIEEALRKTGMSEKQIRKFAAIKVLEDTIAQGRESMNTEKENLKERKLAISADIAKVDKRANPYRDKREEFVRVKEGRPLQMDVKERTRLEEFRGEEEVDTHPREVRPRSPETSGRTSRGAETAESSTEKMEMSVYISGWNFFLTDKYGEEAVEGILIDADDFENATSLSGDYKLSAHDFKEILGRYYKFKRMSLDEEFNENVDEFLEATFSR